MPGMDRDAEAVINRVWVSAQEGVGLSHYAAMVESTGSGVIEKPCI